jgi:hypothetical protein
MQPAAPITMTMNSFFGRSVSGPSNNTNDTASGTFNLHLNQMNSAKKEAFELLGINEVRKVGQPSIIERKQRILVASALEEYSSSKVDSISIRDILLKLDPSCILSKESSEGCAEIKFKEGDNTAISHSVKMSESVLFLKSSLCHIWGKDGSHIGWRVWHEVRDEALKEYQFLLGDSTAKRILHNEQLAYKAGNGIRTKPGILEYQDLTKAYKHINFVEGVNAGTTGSTNFIFNPDWYPEAIEAVLQVEKTRGFGPDIVGALISDLLTKKGASVTFMSHDWILWFLYEKFDPKFVTRKPTTNKCTPAQEEKNELLHQINLDQLLYLREEKGLEWKYYVSSDEFGVKYIPGESQQWARKGAKRVEGTNLSDKRSYTSNMYIQANGDICRLDMIFSGKSEQCLPPELSIQNAKARALKMGIYKFQLTSR